MLRVIKRLGEGTFGVVDSVEDSNGNVFARKTFKAPVLSAVTPESLRKRFIREVRYQSSVDHPNVVKIISSELTSDPPWFLMPLAKGTMKEALEKDRTLGGKAIDALFDILTGLQALHERGIIHRDIKPENILVFANNEGKDIYAISDFGLITANESTSSTLTATNMRGGTPYYAAPECAVDFKRATPLSDIYSFGALLHDIYLPNGNRVPHSELTCPGPMGPIIEKCTKKNALRRYENVAQLRAALYSVASTQDTSISSTAEKQVVALLLKGSDLSDSEWDTVFDYIDECDQSNRLLAPIFAVVSIEHIQQLARTAPPLFAALAREFCRHARDDSFDFNYCDVLADKLQAFYTAGEVDVKAIVGLALLVMGTEHNRWYVERRFVSIFGKAADIRVVQRLILEAQVESISIEGHIRHLERSISIDRAALHPLLAGTES